MSLIPRPFRRKPRPPDAGEEALHLGDGAAAGNRRRLRVFAVTFFSLLAAGQAWNLSRPAEYRATARIQLDTGSRPAPAAPVALAAGPLPADPIPGLPPATPSALLDEVQRLSGDPLMEKLRTRLRLDARWTAGGDTGLEGLREMLSVAPVAGTNVIQLQAVGAAAERPALVLNTLIELYRDDLAAKYTQKSGEELANARQEMTALEGRIAAKQAELEDFRNRHGVFSSERDENEALARVKGLTAALNSAGEKLAAAEARLGSARAAAESGRGVLQPRDNPTLASLEQRASQAREQWRDMERTYTRDFLAMDPQAKALRARLAELEQQMAELRATSQKNAVEEAEAEVDGARRTMARLQQQLAQERLDSRSFVQDFNKARELGNDLSRLEALRRGAMEHLARLDAGAAAAARPRLGIVDQATVPRAPWRPDYLRDGLLLLGAAFLAGLLAMWFVELFHRVAAAAPQATTIFLPPSLVLPAGQESATLPAATTPPSLPEAAAAPALPPGRPVELDQGQLAALLLAGNPEGRVACACLLLGLSVAELCALRRADLAAGGQLHVGGASARETPLPAWLAETLAGPAIQGEADTPLLHDAQGAPLRAEDIASLVCAAAHDAGLEEAESVTPEALRHTGIAWLVRQGVRYSDLAGRVGRLPAEQLAAYARLAAAIPRAPTGRSDAPMPALAEPFSFPSGRPPRSAPADGR